MTAATDLDLDAYLQRIGWTGPTEPSLAVLAGLLRAHMASIPFENLDVLLGRPVRLDLASLQHKLVRARRGGYCFEHATLFAAVLERLGFRLQRHIARVTMFVPREHAGRTHMFLSVRLPEGRFVVDPGFGALAPRGPVPLAEGQVLHIDRERHWLQRDGPWWLLRAQLGGDPVDAWASLLEEPPAIDFEMGNHYTATHPESGFVNGLMLRALTPDGRVGVRNRDVTVWRDGVPQAFQLSDRRALRALLAEHFGFDLPEVETLRVPQIAAWD